MSLILILITIIRYAVQILSLIIIVDIFLSYFMSPYSPVRRVLDGIVEPMLRPIRRIVPPIGMLDLSPLVLLILIQVLGSILASLLSQL